MVLRHLDVTQPNPFLRLWERWGHGDCGGEWRYPASPPRLGWDHQARGSRFGGGDVGSRRAWGNLPRPPPGWSVPFPVAEVEPESKFEAYGDEYTHGHVPRDTSESPSDVDYQRTHRVRSKRALGEARTREPVVTNDSISYPVDESRYANEKEPESVARDLHHDVPQEAKPVDPQLARKKASVQATLERKLGELQARTEASRTKRGGHETAGTATVRGIEVAKDVTITPRTTALAPCPAPDSKRMDKQSVQSYSPAELKKINANCSSPPRGFVADLRWSPAASSKQSAVAAVKADVGVPGEVPSTPPKQTSSSKLEKGKDKAAPAKAQTSAAQLSAAAAEASAAAAQTALEAAEMEAARAATSAVLKANTSRWSLWAPNTPESASKRKELADAFDIRPGHGDGTRFWEPEFLAETRAVAKALHGEVESAALGNNGGTTSDRTPTINSVPEVVRFLPDALMQFTQGIENALAPGVTREPTLGILFGAWSRTKRENEESNAWRAAVAFLQPWQGQALDLATWLEGEDREAVMTSKSNSVAANTLRPIGWLRTTAGLGAGVTEEITNARRVAVEQTETSMSMSQSFGLQSKHNADTETRPPPASSLFVSLDDVRTSVAKRQKNGGPGAVVEIFDLRSGKRVDFFLDGDDAGE